MNAEMMPPPRTSASAGGAFHPGPFFGLANCWAPPPLRGGVASPLGGRGVIETTQQFADPS